MSRQALVVGPALEPDVAMEQTFRRLGYTRITRVGSAADALEFAARENVDLLFLPIDQIDDAGLASVERVSRQDRHIGVVATGPRSDHEYLLRAMRAGIQEFLVRPSSVEELTAVVERLHRRAEVRQVTGQTYAMFSSKGGVGVSTTAVNLASALAMIHNESRVAVVDLAMPGGDVSLLLNAKPSYTIGDLAARIDRLDQDMLFSALTPATDGVWVLAMPEAGNAMDTVDATVTGAVLAQLRQSFTFTLIDCEHQLTERSLAALDAADRVLLLTELKVPALRSTQRTMTVFRRLGYPIDKLCVVVNRYHSSDVVSTGDAARLLNADIYFNIPNDYKASTEAATDGVAIPIRQPNSKLGLAYLQLAQKLAGGELPSNKSQGNGSKSRLKQLFGRGRA
jgi:pilus assembly protein CpaE